MCDVDLSGILALRGDVPTRGHRYKIVQEHCANNYRKNFFAQRVAPVWNSLPPSIVDVSSFSRFKRSLKHVNLSILLVFNFICFTYRCRVSGFVFPSVTCVVGTVVVVCCFALFTV